MIKDKKVKLRIHLNHNLNSFWPSMLKCITREKLNAHVIIFFFDSWDAIKQKYHYSYRSIYCGILYLVFGFQPFRMYRIIK